MNKQIGENMKKQISTLENIDIRSIWKNESSDFTPWLAENINRLGDVIDMDLTVIEEEKPVGVFSADIFCKDENTENNVVIENQLDISDHKHLGQLLTYATGLNAKSIVWLSSEFKDEHRAVLDKLNEITDPDINFFGIKIEAVKIGNSDIAINFKVISQPNEWIKTRSNFGYRCSGKLTPSKILKQDFWTHLNNKIQTRGSFLSTRKPRAQHYHTFKLGNGKSHLSGLLNKREKYVAAEVYIPKDQALYEALKQNKSEIEKEFGEPLDWQDLDDSKASRIKIFKYNFNIENQDQWESNSDWLIDRVEKLYKVFSPRIKQINNHDNQFSIN